MKNPYNMSLWLEDTDCLYQINKFITIIMLKDVYTYLYFCCLVVCDVYDCNCESMTI